MKVIINDDVNMIIFLNKMYLKEIHFHEYDELEKEFKNLLKVLKRYYHINISGYYDVDVYLDSFYGAVLELNHEEMEYFGYFDDEIEIQLKIRHIDFLYKIEDPFFLDSSLKSKVSIYKYKQKLYLKINKKIDDFLLGKIIENSKIQYKLDYNMIIKEKNLVNVI